MIPILLKGNLWGIILMSMLVVNPIVPGLQGTENVLSRLERSHQIVRGFVCTSSNDIRCVDDLCNVDGVAYWSIMVNGNFKDYNSMSVIKPSDKVELKYLPVSSYKER